MRKLAALTVVVQLFVGAAVVLAQQDSLSGDKAPYTLTKDPTTAVLLSLPLPGLGQYYNEQYWKIPLFTGTCAFTAYLFFTNNASFNDASDLYDAAVEAGADDIALSRLRDQREAFRNNRDISGIVFLSAYLLAAVDAYVGAHLHDFNVTEELSVGFGPTHQHFAAVRLNWQW